MHIGQLRGKAQEQPVPPLQLEGNAATVAALWAFGMQRLHNPCAPMEINNEGRAFFVAFGERLSALRKGHGVTQVQVAQLLDVSQQGITSYESGQWRAPISTLPRLARTFGVSLEDLIGVPPSRGTGKRGPAPKLQQQLELELATD